VWAAQRGARIFEHLVTDEPAGFIVVVEQLGEGHRQLVGAGRLAKDAKIAKEIQM
jgi:hypothetical protein